MGGEMARWWRVCNAIRENPSSVLSTTLFTTTYKPSPEERPNAVFWNLWTPSLMGVCARTHKDVQTLIL